MLAYLFVILAIAARFLVLHMQPHPWDFTPVTASLLFFGAYRPSRQLWFPLVLFAASDVFLTKVVYAYAFGWDHFITWAWYAAALFLGTRLRDNSKPVWVLSAALAGSASFFLISNFGVWAAYTMYPKTFAGLLTCYAAGLPFFEHRLVGDLLFTAVLFATPALLTMLSRKTDSTSAAA